MDRWKRIIYDNDRKRILITSRDQNAFNFDAKLAVYRSEIDKIEAFVQLSACDIFFSGAIIDLNKGKKKVFLSETEVDFGNFD